jgi:phenylalanyl-tRNA synthetase beta subunit
MSLLTLLPPMRRSFPSSSTWWLLCLLSIVQNLLRKYKRYIPSCRKPDRLLHSVEPVRVVYPDGKILITPDISSRNTIAHKSYINACTGLSLASAQICSLLGRMSLVAKVSPENDDELLVQVPPTRPDILHECDIMEDAAIAYGFNNLPKTFPPTNTVAQPLAISKLSDLVRVEWAMAGWIEVLPLILVCYLKKILMV